MLVFKVVEKIQCILNEATFPKLQPPLHFQVNPTNLQERSAGQIIICPLVKQMKNKNE